MAEKNAFRRFSGDSDDAGKQLKRWKLWCQAKMMTVKDLQKTQRGPWVYIPSWQGVPWSAWST